MSRISSTDERARLRDVLASSLPRLLPPFLAEQRWFGSKGRPIRAAELEDVAWLPSESPSALAIVRLTYGEGPADRYVMLLGWQSEPRERATVGRCDGPSGRPWLAECSGDPDVAAALLQGFCAPHAMPTAAGGTITYADVPTSPPRRLERGVLDRREVKSLAAEQSNTTLRVGASHVFKLFRRLEAGENPEAEVTRFLTSVAEFDGCPGLRGSVGYQAPSAPGAPAADIGTIGVLEDWVENEGDGWSYALRLLAPPGDGAEGVPRLLADLGVLGRLTAAFHVALASSDRTPDFTPEPFSESDRDAAVAALRAGSRRLFERLRSARASMAPEHRPLVEELLAAEAVIGAWEAPPVTGPGGFRAIRIHGDYHLGQTLKTPGGFVVIDFEGEPAVARAERRRMQPALRDVAGMVRSFDYAAVAAQRGSDAAATASAMRAAYLTAYLERVGSSGAAILPADAEARDGWIRFFELAKALYEVEYELDNRPAWLSIPLQGIRRLLQTADSKKGHHWAN
jgi:trehalose synthase-fused probable maltokinase